MTAATTIKSDATDKMRRVLKMLDAGVERDLIADRMGVSKNAVRKILDRAREARQAGKL